jgi:hypothetical protein
VIEDMSTVPRLADKRLEKLDSGQRTESYYLTDRREDPNVDVYLRQESGPKIPDDIQESSKAAVPRIAGNFTSIPTPPSDLCGDSAIQRPNEPKFKPVACVRNLISIWFDNFESLWQKGA